METGVHGNLYRWIKNFSTDRHTFSSKSVLEIGRPQGSALGCTLFLLFINYLPDKVKADKALHADDLTFWQKQKRAGTCAILLP